MIKINLRPDIVKTEGDISEVGDASAGSDIQRKGLVNILVILIIPAALFVYESQVKPEKENKIRTLNAQIAELTSFNNKQSAIVAEISKIEADEKDVEKKINAIAKITQGRLSEIKVLDLLQSILPEKMWLQNIEIETVDGKGTQIQIDGMSQTEMDVSILLDDLTRNVLFKDVELIESKIQPYEGQNFSMFRIQGHLEKSK